MILTPYTIDLHSIGDEDSGFISVSEKNNLPFLPKRIYWTYQVPYGVVRGNHAHYELEQILVAVAGIIEIEIETLKNEKFIFKLDKPDLGLYIPVMCWRNIKYSQNSVLMCIASLEYDEKDYIRDYFEFQKLKY